MKTLLATIAIAATAVSASAADLAPVYKSQQQAVAVPYSWTGFYLGANVGLGFSDDSLGISGTDVVGGLAVATGLVPGTIATRPQGFFGGGQVGYNWQLAPMLVLGVEADIQGSGISGSDSQVLTTAPLGLPVSLTTTGSTDLNWFGTVRARLGVLLTPNTLIYATGGLAYGGVKSSVVVNLAAPAPFGATAAFSSDSVQTGWTIGGGFEYKLAQNWSLGAEYLYLDLGDVGGSFGTTIPITRTGIPVNFNASQSLTNHLGRIKLNYAF